MPNPQSPQGGLFGRYQGEQVSQFPPGYAEAMAARGHALAGIGQNIMNATLHKMKMERQ